MQKFGIRFRILLPTAAVLITLFIGFFAGIWFLLDHDLIDDSSRKLSSSEHFYKNEIEDTKQILTSVTDVLARSVVLRKAWAQKDRKAMLESASSIFTNLRATYQISHLYFIEPDQTVFLRVHQPEQFGDMITRLTMRQAAEKQKVTTGIDLGKHGTFSFRVIRPIRTNKEVIGYIEVAKEITSITQKLQEIIGVNIIVLIDKKYFDKGGLAEHKYFPRHKLHWDIMPDEVVLSRHPDDLPDQLIAGLKTCDLSGGKQASIYYSSEKTYCVGGFPIQDVSGSNVGRIVILKDVSSKIASARSLEYTLGGVFGSVALIFFGLSYWYLGRIENQIDRSNRMALEEAASRERAKLLHLQEVQRFEKALNGATDAICITDIAGHPIYYNDAFVKLFGVPHHTSDAEKGLQIIYGDPQFVKTMLEKVTKKQSYEGVSDMLSRGGEPKSILIRGSAIEGDGGDVIGLLIIHTDITERKRAEDELRRQAAALRENNIALEEARAAAQAATMAKSEFLANMSHEIRTPMTAILGFSETLLDLELSDQDRKKAIDAIHRNGKHLLQLINEVLDLSKIEAGKIAIEPNECSIPTILRDIISLMQFRAKAKGLKITLECKGLIPETIRTDAIRLRQILINLLGNAIKFTEVGEVRISVGLKRDANRAAIIFDVIDTGIGIPPDQLELIFRPFSQADETVTRKYGGAGLGLAICQRLASVLHGKITVKSTLGHGSTFRLSIPIGASKGSPMIDNLEKYFQNAMPVDGELQADQKDSLQNISGHILLVEDGPDNQMLISLILRKAGARVTVAENGRIALDYAWQEKAKSAAFDLILMDMQMPVLDGYAATRELRAGGYDGPIIALTAHAMNEDRDKCLQAGCDYYLSKPITREILVATVAQFLPQPVEQ